MKNYTIKKAKINIIKKEYKFFSFNYFYCNYFFCVFVKYLIIKYSEIINHYV